MPKIIVNNEYITVSAKLVEEIFPSTNATFIKVYMHVLMLASKQKSINLSEVADSLQLLESDVKQAITYWQSHGALVVAEDNDLPKEIEEKPEKPLYELQDITLKAEENSKLAEMLKIAQEVLAKPISNAEMKTLYWMYEDLGFSPEVILMLLEYCVSIGKKNMQYIERVATSWHSKGVSSIEDVEEFLQQEEYTKNYMNSLRFVFGIKDRAFTSIEEDYLKKWHDELMMNEEMIALAYEYCILRINKLSFPYMDKIISDWSLKNIRTIDEAEKENELFKKNKADSHESTQEVSRESNELEQFTWGNVD